MTERIEIKPNMTFREASQRWLDSSCVSRSENTKASYEQYVAALRLFFADTRLCDIRLNHIAAYQTLRSSGDGPFIRKRRPQDQEASKLPVKAKKCNQELAVLIRILRWAGLWTEQDQKLYLALPEENEEIPRALTPSEQRRWLEIAMRTSDIVHWYSLLAFDTCMSTDEIRNLRLGDINLFSRSLTIRKGKNKHRNRTIGDIDTPALFALEKLIARAHDMGSADPAHYLFPWRIAAGKWDAVRKTRLGIYDPMKPMSESGIKKEWEKVRRASGLTWFRQYDCRHTAITRMAEAGAPIHIIMERAGHVSLKMNRHYTHLSAGYKSGEMERIRHVNAVRMYGHAPGGDQVPPMPYNPPAPKMPLVSYGTSHIGWTGLGALPIR